MKNGLIFVIGLFAAVTLSWAAIVMGSTNQLGDLPPYYSDADGTSFPQWLPGTANQGQRVYRDLGCAECHTQQVRRPDLGSDQARGWGDRQSVARDYIYQPFPQIGSSRVGPDLANLAARKPSAPDAGDLLNLLYTGEGGMPSYRFLFERRKVVGDVSAEALSLVGNLRPPAGWEIVPTERAEALVAYLLSLNSSSYDLPEARPVLPPSATPAKTPVKTPAPKEGGK